MSRVIPSCGLRMSARCSSRAGTAVRRSRGIKSGAKRPIGYDGQFFLYIALDPLHARDYMDVASYRYSRPVYPLTVRVLALGRAQEIPWALLVLRIAGVVAATFAVARLFERERISPWWALLLGLYPGLLVAVTWDLAEAMAYGLAAVGLLLFDRGRRPLAAAACFGLAGATRETMLLFPVALAVWLAWKQRRVREAIYFMGIACLPHVAIKLGLALWLHSDGAPAQRGSRPSRSAARRSVAVDRSGCSPALFVALPGVAALFVAWRAYRALEPELLALLLNVLVLVVLCRHRPTRTTSPPGASRPASCWRSWPASLG